MYFVDFLGWEWKSSVLLLCWLRLLLLLLLLLLEQSCFPCRLYFLNFDCFHCFCEKKRRFKVGNCCSQKSSYVRMHKLSGVAFGQSKKKIQKSPQDVIFTMWIDFVTYLCIWLMIFKIIINLFLSCTFRFAVYMSSLLVLKVKALRAIIRWTGQFDGLILRKGICLYFLF